ncbi:hypothetical protein ACFST9_02265 [Hymenobacter monticola]|uniref:Uncharacterized protein n=1 Tax=Hymenobacter monticola TaxID=1705399 RepID=A0ABY4B268_9BACT|nr:hypothetical protein [Hymenobacter monticola]UOE33214.1 hypothetical protein MTP16_19065 [Hymenobacter monticola]
MPATLASAATSEEVIGLVDQWTVLLEQEKYEEAYAFLEAEPFWSAVLIKEIIQAYGDELKNKVTLLNNGTAVDSAGNIRPAKQRKEVEWYSEKRSLEEGIGWFDENRGDVWYDLNINGFVSDLTATFNLEKRNDRLHVILQDIHVM